jgi:hypothetical protein
MTFRHWRVAALLAPAAITAVALAIPAVTASASPSWQLADQYTSTPACVTTAGGTEDLELNLNGTWSTSLTFGASGLPKGGSYSDLVLVDNLTNNTFSTGSPPIPPGWSNGTGPFAVTANSNEVIEAYPVTTIPAGLAVNSTITITFWVNDGTTTQTESVPVQIKSSCKRRY